MKILIVGNGGREHALLWKLSRDAPDADFYVTLPNGGLAPAATAVPIDPGAVESLASWAEGEGIDLTVVGPEAPLAAGLIDLFRSRGLPAFGPTADAARIEASKAYAKRIMERNGVPTATHESFTDFDAAAAHIRERGAPIVVKASGLAAGKGSIVCQTTEEAVEAARGMLEEDAFGGAGETVVVEEHMDGEELSVFVLTDGENVVPLLSSQDHKPVGEGDVGPNTGGMGAYAPVSIATPELLAEVRRTIIEPTLAGLADDGAPYRGVLYAGLMLTEDGPKVVEFNCRFGDPEAQVVLPLLESSLLDLLEPIARDGDLGEPDLRWRQGRALITVLASGGYPGPYEKGKEIDLPGELEEAGDVIVFHAGTRRLDGRLLTDGGRVLGVTGLGGTLAEAARRSREGAAAIDFEGKHFRSDIGWRELEREV